MTDTTAGHLPSRFYEKLLEFLTIKDLESFQCICFEWLDHEQEIQILENALGVPSTPLLSTCFRRAANPYLRKLDYPPPNVNCKGPPVRIKGALVVAGPNKNEYLLNLKRMYQEHRVLQDIRPSSFSTTSQQNAVSPGDSDYVRLVLTRSSDSLNAITGSINKRTGNAEFNLWANHSRTAAASITCASASAYDACDTGLAVGCTDGSIKVWNLTTCNRGVNPSPSVTLRSGLPIPSYFLPTKSTSRVSKLFIDNGNRRSHHTRLRVASTTVGGDVTVWDAVKGKATNAFRADLIKATALGESNSGGKGPLVTSIMTYDTKLVCGTSSGLIRVFDLRSGELVFRVSGHRPAKVTYTRTNGGAVWSSGDDGSVKWWGSKSGKKMEKSGLCYGNVSALEVNDNVVLAGYEVQGMTAWDLRSRDFLCSFSNFKYGGIKHLQFDSTKIVTVSSTGKAAVWRWYEQQRPYYCFPDHHFYVSSFYTSEGLVLGTSSGEALAYPFLSRVS